MEELVISRKVWLRGEGEDNSYLLREKDGKMCCVGIYLLSQGVQPDDIAGMVGPCDVAHLLSQLGAGWLLQSLGFRAMIANDDPVWPDEFREKVITELFAQRGIAVTFTD